MFDSFVVVDAVGVDQVRRQLTAACGVAGLDDAGLVDLLTALEGLKNAAAGLQARAAVALDASQRAVQAAAGVPRRRQGLGVGSQVALARRESPALGRRHLELARILTRELPWTLAALCEGRISEWRATLIARETACLSLADRALIDDELAGTPAAVEELERWGDRRTVATIAARAAALDPQSVLERRRRAERDRRVSGRPAPDTMMHLSALLPVRDGVGVIAALTQAANTAVATGDDRTRGQVMADTLIARITGRDPVTDPIPVTINVVLPDTALLPDNPDDDGEGGWLEGYGPIPADLARAFATEPGTLLRRLYATPSTGALVAMESTARRFPTGLATLVRFRDRTCRTPWCDATIRHLDHIVPHAHDGPTSATNAQGLCEACNHAKQAPGWRHTVVTTTPTGHTHTSTAPAARRPSRPEQSIRPAQTRAWHRSPARRMPART